MQRKGKPLITILTDIYWPSCGGVEESIRSIVTSLSYAYDFRIITHSNKRGRPGIINQSILLPDFKPYYDEAGNAIVPVVPCFAERCALIPFLIWYVPLMRRLGAKKLFDFLYPVYENVFFPKLKKEIGETDLIHNFSTGYLAICAAEISRQFNIPLIQAPPVHFDRWGDSPLQLHAYTQADTLFCPTALFKQKIIRRTRDISARLVINPPLPSFPPEYLIPPSGFDPTVDFILFLGRREPHKGFNLLLQAFESIKTSYYLVFAGPGKKQPLSHPQCIDLGEVDDNVKYWLLQNCRIFCLPSQTESFGMVYIEAMGCKKPIVALDIEPVNEIVINNVSGILIPPDDISALAQTLLKLITDQGLRNTIGAQAWKRYSRFYSRKQILHTVQGEYRRLVGGDKG